MLRRPCRFRFQGCFGKVIPWLYGYIDSVKIEILLESPAVWDGIIQLADLEPLAQFDDVVNGDLAFVDVDTAVY
jgi:hypothetical protein